MMKMRILSVVCLVAVCFITECKIVLEAISTNRTVKALKIEANEITPWTQDAGGYREFSNLRELTIIMNGGADEYYNRYAIDGFFQYMSNTINATTTYTVECRVMDFGTAAKAATMFNYMVESISTKQAVGKEFPLTNAVIYPDASLYGLNAYACFGQYYFELAFDGYGSNKPEAAKNAAGFIRVFSQKVNAM